MRVADALQKLLLLATYPHPLRPTECDWAYRGSSSSKALGCTVMLPYELATNSSCTCVRCPKSHTGAGGPLNTAACVPKRGSQGAAAAAASAVTPMSESNSFETLACMLQIRTGKSLVLGAQQTS